MPFSPLVHIIALSLILWFAVTAVQLDAAKQFTVTIYGLVSGFILWVVIATLLAIQDVYFNYNAEFLPVIILSSSIVSALPVVYFFSTRIRGLVDMMIDKITRRQIAVVYIARILAIGAIYKMFIGALPVHFVASSAVPDLFFGLSAIYVAWRAERLSNRFFILWNIAGIAILFTALITMHFTLPGLLHFVSDGPTAREVVSFPMVLVPLFVAPFFINLHLLAIAKTWKQGKHRDGRMDVRPTAPIGPAI